MSIVKHNIERKEEVKDTIKFSGAVYFHSTFTFVQIYEFNIPFFLAELRKQLYKI